MHRKVCKVAQSSQTNRPLFSMRATARSLASSDSQSMFWSGDALDNQLKVRVFNCLPQVVEF